MEQLTPATPADRDPIAALLAECGLPNADIDPHLPNFTVARDGGRVVGVGGIEVHGDDALLRSMAVAPDRRGEGIARRLYASVLGRARTLGVGRLFLLTTSAQGFFELLGFRQIDRESVPEAIRATEEFRALCPSSAICMTRTMRRD